VVIILSVATRRVNFIRSGFSRKHKTGTFTNHVTRIALKYLITVADMSNLELNSKNLK